MDSPAQLTAALQGRYAVDREIGRGGMATVYLARDLRHNRRVALKVLNPELGAILGVERFLAEIQVTANLQHPNLLPLFDSGEADGLLFYVMPFVEGESLRTRLDREKQLPVDEALRIATAMASALDYAHRQGVIHRDLKPDNVLLHEGQPLIADFGIALAISNAGGSRITQTGLSLGTPQYMSPEQATGDRAIDGRTDIYSLAAMLYEMLTGDPPHLGSTAQAVIAKVLTDRPRSVRASRASVPANVSAAIDRALEKLPADRFATAHEFAEAIRPQSSPSVEVPVDQRVAMPRETRQGSRRAFITVSCVALAASALAAWGWLRPRAPIAESSARFVVTLPPDIAFDNVYSPLTITRDGRSIIFRASFSGAVRLARRKIDELEARPLAGTDGAGWPVVSPDNKWIAFRTSSQIRKVPIDGGVSVPIMADDGGSGFDWVRNEMLVVCSTSKHAGLSVVSASGGTPQQITTVDSTKGETNHGWPRVLADGNTVVYVVSSKDGWENSRLAVTTLSKHESTLLDIKGTAPLGVFEGHLVYVGVDGVLMAVPFNVRSRKTTGPPIALIDNIAVIRAVGAARVTLSNTGTLVYLPATGASQLVAVDSTGAPQPLASQPGAFSSPAWSPDGHRIAVAISTPQGSDVWLYDIVTNTRTQLTSDGASGVPSWTADGRRVVFASTSGGHSAVWWQSADGSAAAEKLGEIPGETIQEAMVSPDNTALVVRTGPSNSMYSINLGGDRGAAKFAPQHTRAHPVFSSDGKWIAYSNDLGAGPQVVVQAFPIQGAPTQISVDGGTEPIWSPDGKRLYYRKGTQVIAVPIANGSVARPGAPRVLFEGAYVALGLVSRQSISVSPDGKRFVMLRRVEDDARLVVTTNWMTELRAAINAAHR